MKRPFHIFDFMLVLACSAIFSVSGIKQGFSQTTGQEYQQINWRPDEIISTIDGGDLRIAGFENAVYQSATATLPMFEFPEISFTGLFLQHIEIQPILVDTLPQFNNLPLADEGFLSSEFQLYKNENSNKTLLLPLRRNGSVIERLQKFTFTFDLNPESNISNEDPMPLYASNSVLKDGDWYKLGVTNQGIHKIGYQDLQAMGINPESINPQHIKIYGNGNGMLPESNSRDRIDDLRENAIYVSGQQDGRFDQNDYILFYALEPVAWTFNIFTGRFEHQVNLFTDTTYYFLTPGNNPGLRIQTKPQAGGLVTQQVDRFVAPAYHESEYENLLLSGKDWYGETFTILENEHEFTFELPNIIASQAVYFHMQFVARSVTEDVAYSVYVNDSMLVDQESITKLTVNQSTYARESNQTLTFFPNSSTLKFRIKFHANDIGSRGWLNYLQLNAWRGLDYDGGQLEFRSPHVTGAGNITKFNINTNKQGLSIWEITNRLQPIIQEFSTNGDGLQFITETDSLRTFIIADGLTYHPIASSVQIPNQDLHGIAECDMLIICHPEFLAQAEELSLAHLEDDGLVSKVIDVRQVYNEFGGGTPDPTALRDFIRMVYLKSSGNMRYLLLFGDASYDYKDRIAENTNFIPTYQSKNSLTKTGSFVSDDYFGLLDINEGFNMAGNLDIGIGRFPVTTQEEAAIMVGKTIDYLSKNRQVTRNWRNEILFVADDQDNNLHLDQAEALSRIVDTSRNILNIKKIYIDNYQQITVPGGHRYPQANAALLNTIEKGVLIVNYTGHGGINGLTDERVFPATDVSALKNTHQLPLFITATCEFSRYDDPHFVSAGERLILNPDGGGVALMTTTRLAWAHSNFALNKKIYEAMFNSQVNLLPRLGDVMRISKNPSSSSVFNFVLLGDPALRLVSPEKRIETTMINSTQVGSQPDTIGAMSVVNISGKIVLPDGTTDIDFNGILNPKVYDKKTVYRTLGNDNNSIPVNISYFDKVLYQGEVTVSNGLFSFSFALPKDISFHYGFGKISYYAVDTLNFTDASGVYHDIVIGGTDEEAILDMIGPEVDLVIDTWTFKPGNVVSESPTLMAKVTDPQGINFLGNNIGRDITMTLNEDPSQSFILNAYYSPDLDSYTSGVIKFPMDKLGQGQHQVKLKVWDLHNNSSESETWFVVNNNAPLTLSGVVNHPNPFSDQTAFIFNHDKPGKSFDVLIDIFRIDGQKIITIERKANSIGNQSEQLIWNGKDYHGNLVPSGLYVYRMLVTDPNGISTLVSNRLIISRQ